MNGTSAISAVRAVEIEEGWIDRRMSGSSRSTGGSSKAEIVSIDAYTVKRRLGYRIIKRTFDIIISALALIILSPVFLVTAIAIKIEDKGPVFFTQERVGMGGTVFSMFKYRSMKVGSADIHEDLKERYGCDDVSFKLKDDPRVTKVGKKIRAMNIDELPQLLNILKGDMSFVGPRPLPVYEYEDEQRAYKGKFDKRYAVPQGLTCIWQISNRSEPDFAERMQMDVDYAEQCGLLMDLKLFIQTFIYAMFGKAAY